MKELIKKFSNYMKGNSRKELYDYADTEIECIALYFIATVYSIWWFVSRLFLLVTCPLWIVPYCIYKDRK